MLTEFWLGGRFFARFGVNDSRPFTGCNCVAYLAGIPIGAAARFALLVFFKPVNNGRFNLALSSFPASVKLAVVVVIVC